MNQIINSVFAEIGNCSHLGHHSSTLRACIDSKVESLALTGMLLVDKNPYKKEENKQDIKRMVREAIADCSSSLEEIGYDTSGLKAMETCVIQRGDRLVDMAVDMMTDGLTEKEIYEGTRRCSRRKSSKSKRKGILKSLSRRKSKKSKSPCRRIVWKR
jgi:hypothetical protein